MSLLTISTIIIKNKLSKLADCNIYFFHLKRVCTFFLDCEKMHCMTVLLQSREWNGVV